MYYLETFSTDPCYNLAFEEYILTNRRQGDWLLLWQNENTVVVGLNQNAEEEINRPFVDSHHITVVRRTTGGGAVYHDLGNLNYSFISDLGDAQTLSLSKFTAPVCQALAELGVSAQLGGRNDIMVDGKKVSGVAQRIMAGRILHHGTLLFDSDEEMIAGALQADPAKFASKSAKSVRSRVGNIRKALPRDMELAEFWEELLGKLSSQGAERTELEPEELEQVRRLADEKYRSWDWTFGRSPKYGFKNRRRFPGGTLGVSLDVQAGRIENAVFFGDFMAVSDCGPAERALCGRRFEAGELRAALGALELEPMFGTVSLDEILSVMFGEGTQL